MADFIDENRIVYSIDASKKKLTIGRSEECDITIPPTGSEMEKQIRCPTNFLQIAHRTTYYSVSRQHVTFRPKERLIIDNNSSYGTRVNDTKLEPKHAITLKSGDSVVFGTLCLYYIE